MISFIVAAVGLALLAVLMLGRTPHTPRRPAMSSLALREQLVALDAEFARGFIDRAELARSRSEIERRALEEVGIEARLPDARAESPSRRASIGLGALIIASAFGIYALLGNTAALVPMASQPSAAEVPTQAVEAMLDSMARQMETQAPGSTDAAGWTLLARSYASLQRFEDASRAYARALALSPDDAQLLVDQADVLAMRQGGRTEGEPSRLIARALRIAPDNLKALALGGTEAFERRDFAEARRLWLKASMLSPPGVFAQRMQQNLDALPSEASAGPSAGPSAAASAAAGSASSASSANAGWIAGRVRLSPALAASVQPGDTLFVFARAENGPRMPLAIARHAASALPLEFRLDDSNAMSTAMKLSDHARVVVGARLSRSGDALPRAGDFYGESAAVATGSGSVDIVIDSEVR